MTGVIQRTLLAILFGRQSGKEFFLTKSGQQTTTATEKNITFCRNLNTRFLFAWWKRWYHVVQVICIIQKLSNLKPPWYTLWCDLKNKETKKNSNFIFISLKPCDDWLTWCQTNTAQTAVICYLGKLEIHVIHKKRKGCDKFQLWLFARNKQVNYYSEE